MTDAPVMRSPRHVDIEVTARCNLRCAYCYREGTPAGRELSTAQWKSLFEELGAASVMAVTLAGGEPFVRADLPELLAGVVRRGMRFSILTNGTLVDGRAADAVAAHARRCDFVQVSLDDGAAQGHDALRGAGSFEQAVRGARLLLARGMTVTARLTVHRRNFDRLEGAVRFLLEDLGVAQVSTNAAAALGACAGQGGAGDAGIVLGPAERRVAMAALTGLAERYPGRVMAEAGPLADARRYARMEEALTAGAPAFGDGGRLTGCGCAFESLAVRADGAYLPCLLLPTLELGRVGVDRLVDVWRDAPALRELRARCEIPLASLLSCADCRYAPYCTGNCPAAVFAATGKLAEAAPEACLRLFKNSGRSC